MLAFLVLDFIMFETWKHIIIPLFHVPVLTFGQMSLYLILLLIILKLFKYLIG